MRAHLPFKPGPKTDDLIRRQEYLSLMIDSHRRWMSDADDQHLQQLHHSLIESLQNVVEQYNILLDELQSSH